MFAFIKIALPVLATASTAYAACSISATTTIQNSGDASALASCSTFSGNIAIATGATGPLAIDGVQKITGNLVAETNPNVTVLSGDSLEEIEGDFKLQDVRSLNSISFPQLSTVGTLKWISVSVLSTLELAITQADGIDIENTQLQSLVGINLETVGDVKIVNNKFINEITMQVTNITGALVFEGNNPELVVKLDQLKAANNLTFQGCSSIDLPVLTSLNDSLVLLKNSLESFIAPNVTTIGNSLIVNDNTELTNVSFPQLTEVSRALQIANNTALEAIDGLPKLKKIGADLDLHGNFSELALPSLSDVIGTFNIQSTGDIQGTCDEQFKPLSTQGGSGRIQGKYTCVGKVINPGGEGTTPSTTGGTSPTGAASSLNAQAGALSFAGFFAAFLL